VLGPLHAPISVGDFRFAFTGAGLICLLGVMDFLWLDGRAGAAVSGHRDHNSARSAL